MLRKLFALTVVALATILQINFAQGQGQGGGGGGASKSYVESKAVQEISWGDSSATTLGHVIQFIYRPVQPQGIPASYEWFVNGVSYGSSTVPTLDLYAVNEDVGVVTLKAKNFAGAVIDNVTIGATGSWFAGNSVKPYTTKDSRLISPYLACELHSLPYAMPSAGNAKIEIEYQWSSEAINFYHALNPVTLSGTAIFNAWLGNFTAVTMAKLLDPTVAVGTPVDTLIIHFNIYKFDPATQTWIYVNTDMQMWSLNKNSSTGDWLIQAY